MDTICINKESSAELDESIRSMFKWYCDTSICVIYLAETITLQQMRNDPWFTRSWALQELLAPEHIKLYGSDWQKVVPGMGNDKENFESIVEEIQAATTITQSELYVFQRTRRAIPISRRMQWAASRRVTREEDTAYSLMGIFDVSISIAYGEGSERAFLRLLREIRVLGSSDHGVQDVVNWGWGPELEHFNSDIQSSHFIPSGPKQYL